MNKVTSLGSGEGFYIEVRELMLWKGQIPEKVNENFLLLLQKMLAQAWIVGQ